MGKILTVIFLIAIFGSFSTLADPMAAVLATLSCKNISVDEEAPKSIKIIMGIIISFRSYILVASGGISSVKGLFVIIGLPISVILILCYIAAFVKVKSCYVDETDE